MSGDEDPRHGRTGPRHHETWFGPPDRPLHGWVCTPADGRAATGVVLCSPIGEEGRASHRTMRRLAESLARAGVVVLRFDYDGTGDSAGHPRDPGRVDSWLASIEAAIAVVRSTGVGSVSLVGMRLGATLAATALTRPGSTARLASFVLWDPCASGRRFLRQGEALQRLSTEATAHQDTTGAADDGLRHTPGFQYDAATASDLRRVDLTKLPATGRLARRVLLLERTDRPGALADAEPLRRLTESLETAPAAGQDLLLDVPPSDTTVPDLAIATITRWLGDDVEAGRPTALRLPDGGGTAAVPSGPVGSPASVTVHERGVRLGRHGLYGVVTEPAPGAVPGVVPEQPWVVLVNVAIEHHVGPGRRWVELARAWAALGCRVVRLDQSGVGESATRAGQPEDVLFAPEWIEELPEVVGELRADGPVILVSLCSGVASALEAARRSDVDSIFGVNPRLTLFEAGYDTPGYSRDRLAATTPYRPVVWLARRHRILAGGLWRIYRQVALWHAPALFLDRVVRAGTRVEVVSCPDDAQHFTEVLAWRPMLRRRRREGTLRLESTDLLDHSLLSRTAQELFVERSTAFVLERHRELSGRRAGPPRAAGERAAAG
jgi:alpha-beta hydrolase superfamily lysophospholipase